MKKVDDKYLKKLNDIFPNMPDEIKKVLKIKKLNSKEFLFHKGDEGKKIYILCEGTVKALNFFKNGNIYEIDKNTSICFLGEQQILSGNSVYAVSIETVTPCVFLILEDKYFFQWLKQDIELNHFLLKQLSSRLYKSALKKGNNSYLSSKELVLIDFMKRYEDSSKQTLIIEQTQQELSEQIGISLRSLSRVVTELKKENLIIVDRKKKINITVEQYRKIKEINIKKK